MKQRDIFQVAFGYTHLYVLSLRLYGGCLFSIRRLGLRRVAVDCGVFSLIFERYTQ